jgi:hypothetical protein
MIEILSAWCKAAELGNLLGYAAQTFEPTPNSVWQGINGLAAKLQRSRAHGPYQSELAELVLREITSDSLAPLVVAVRKHEAGQDWKPHLEKFGQVFASRLKALRPKVDDLSGKTMKWKHKHYLGHKKLAMAEYEFLNCTMRNYVLAAANNVTDALAEDDPNKFLENLARFEVSMTAANKLFNELPENERRRLDRFTVGVPSRKLWAFLNDVLCCVQSIKFSELERQSVWSEFDLNGLPYRPNDWFSIIEEIEAIDFAGDVKPVKDDRSIQQDALRAVVDAGFVAVLEAAGNAPSAERISEVMLSMVVAQTDRYWWAADRWIIELGQSGIKCSKPTIIGNKKRGIPACPAWAEIMAWRESNKQNRFPKKPAKNF